jgi:hypothetical protein
VCCTKEAANIIEQLVCCTKEEKNAIDHCVSVPTITNCSFQHFMEQVTRIMTATLDRFDALRFLHLVRAKSILFVGDSLVLNYYESHGTI